MNEKIQMYNKWNFNKKWRWHSPMRMDALHISIFKIRTVWAFTVIMTKPPNRSVSTLLEPIVHLPYTGKRPLDYHVSYRNDTLCLKFSRVQAKCNGSESFCCQVQSDPKSGQYTMKVCLWWHDMIVHFCQTLAGIIFLILIMFEEEHE